MKSWIRKAVIRHPMAAIIIVNLVLILTTGLFAVIALGPDGQLQTHCVSSRGCITSHRQAAVLAIVCGVLTVLSVGLSVRAIKSGRLKKGRWNDTDGDGT